MLAKRSIGVRVHPDLWHRVKTLALERRVSVEVAVEQALTRWAGWDGRASATVSQKSDLTYEADQ